MSLVKAPWSSSLHLWAALQAPDEWCCGFESHDAHWLMQTKEQVWLILYESLAQVNHCILHFVFTDELPPARNPLKPDYLWKSMHSNRQTKNKQTRTPTKHRTTNHFIAEFQLRIKKNISQSASLSVCMRQSIYAINMSVVRTGSFQIDLITIINGSLDTLMKLQSIAYLFIFSIESY